MKNRKLKNTVIVSLCAAAFTGMVSLLLLFRRKAKKRTTI